MYFTLQSNIGHDVKQLIQNGYYKHLQLTTFGQTILLLPEKDRRRIIPVIIIQILLSLLDLIGVLLIGILASLSMSNNTAEHQLSYLTTIKNLLPISELNISYQLIYVGGLAVFILLGRTWLSIFFTKKILKFFSMRGAEITSNLVRKLLAQSVLFLQQRSTQETVFALTRGVELVTMFVLANSVVLVADVVLLIVLISTLLILNPITALGLVFVYVATGLGLHRFMYVRAGKIGTASSEVGIESSEKIVEVLSLFREILVRDRRNYYALSIESLRRQMAGFVADLFFMPYLSKYLIESMIIIGGLIVVGSQFLLNDSLVAATNLGIFFAASTRIAPAVLRLQQGIVQINSSIGQATATLDLARELQYVKELEYGDIFFRADHSGFTPHIQIQGVSFSYPESKKRAITKFSLDVPSGSFVAFVGPSGAGKSTIIDLILGILEPESGSVLISNVQPIDAISKWPGAISYVPQDVHIINGTIRQNIGLGFPNEVVSDSLIQKSVNSAELQDFIASLPDGINTQVGEQGTKLSGGERQRLGISRALFSQPRLLVLDEATSSLDGSTEARISESIQKLRGSTTVLVIAHRLSTIRNADVVVYMENGELIAKGSFDEVRSEVPNFDMQAKLMGL